MNFFLWQGSLSRIEKRTQALDNRGNTHLLFQSGGSIPVRFRCVARLRSGLEGTLSQEDNPYGHGENQDIKSDGDVPEVV